MKSALIVAWGAAALLWTATSLLWWSNYRLRAIYLTAKGAILPYLWLSILAAASSFAVFVTLALGIGT